MKAVLTCKSLADGSTYANFELVKMNSELRDLMHVVDFSCGFDAHSDPFDDDGGEEMMNWSMDFGNTGGDHSSDRECVLGWMKRNGNFKDESYARLTEYELERMRDRYGMDSTGDENFAREENGQKEAEEDDNGGKGKRRRLD